MDKAHKLKNLAKKYRPSCNTRKVDYSDIDVYKTIKKTIDK